MIKIKAKDRGDGCDLIIKVSGKNEEITREAVTLLTKFPEILQQRAPEVFELTARKFREDLVRRGVFDDEDEIEEAENA